MTTTIEDFAGTIEERLASVAAPGAVVALSMDGDVSTLAVGHADLRRETPLQADAVFSLYSITKTLIATLILRLQEGDHAFSLDDALQWRLPEFPFSRPVLLRQVLNHTGGLPDYGPLPEYAQAIREHPETPWSRDEFLKRTLGEDLLYIPGHGWRYSNIGYMLLRQTLEEETGLSLGQMIRLYLGAPLGLASLGVADNLADMARLTPGYSSWLRDDDALENVTARYHPGWVAHGMAIGAAADVARLLDALFGERTVIGSQLVDEMLTGAPVAEDHPWFVKPAYGLGVMMDTASPFGVVAGHTGGGPGYATAAYHFQDVRGHRASLVALVNRDGSDVANDIVFSVAEQLS